jgi:hypothetical protein
VTGPVSKTISSGAKIEFEVAIRNSLRPNEQKNVQAAYFFVQRRAQY